MIETMANASIRNAFFICLFRNSEPPYGRPLIERRESVGFVLNAREEHRKTLAYVERWQFCESRFDVIAGVAALRLHGGELWHCLPVASWLRPMVHREVAINPVAVALDEAT